MEHTVVVTGGDRGLGFALCSSLLEQGWRVFAGQFMPDWPELSALKNRHPRELHIIPLDVRSADSACAAAQLVAAHADHVDVLINNAGIRSSTADHGFRESLVYAEMQCEYDVNALGPLRVMEAFLPLMDRGHLKRLCFVSSEAGSISRSQRTTMFGYCMSKAALNMAIKILFNDLHPEGYTFRVYHPGWIRSYLEGKKNLEADLDLEEAAAKAVSFFLGVREDEDRLVLVDYERNEWSW
jgi:NAD(P)-dependent dehydrogenase (short-subunit alcohol dehydrogenase family)